MTWSTSDHSILHHHTFARQCIYLIVYVDDIVITDNDHDGIRKLKQHLFGHFQTKDLYCEFIHSIRKVEHFLLSLHINQLGNSIFFPIGFRILLYINM